MPVKSVDRAIDVLMQFIDSPIMGAMEIQQKIDLPRPTLYRMLSALETKGLISSSGDPRQYRLGPQILKLAAAWRQSFDLNAISSEFLEALHNETGESIILSVPQPDLTRIVVREIRSDSPLTYSRSAGYTTPLTRGAGAKVILAFYSAADIERALNEVSSTIEREDIRQDLERIKSTKYFFAHGEVIPGAASIAAAIFGPDRKIIGSVGLLGPDVRIRTTDKQRLVGLVLDAADKISRAAGCESP